MSSSSDVYCPINVFFWELWHKFLKVTEPSSFFLLIKIILHGFRSHGHFYGPALLCKMRIVCTLLFIYLETGSCSVAQAGVSWCSHSSLEPYLLHILKMNAFFLAIIIIIYGCIVFHGVYVPHFLYPVYHWWAFGLIPSLCYCEQCHNKHTCTCVFIVEKFIILWVYTQ